MEEGLLKEDGHKAMKKTLAAFSVFALAVAMVGAFASFHWLYGEYFRFAANKFGAAILMKTVEYKSSRQPVVSATPVA